LSSNNVLLIGVWGLPSRWYYTEYIPLVPIKDISKWTKRTSWKYDEENKIYNYSTTAVIAYTLKSLGYNVTVRLYGLDTLASPARNREDKNKYISTDKEEADQELNKLIDEEFFTNDPRDYEEVVKRAYRILDLYARIYFKDFKGEIAEKILPGIGMFKLINRSNFVKKYIFIGSPLNTALALEIDLYNLLRYNQAPDAIVLDVSHGINFLPIIAVETISRFTKLCSVLSDKNIPLIIMNSDPVNEHGKKARIHIVKTRNIEYSVYEFLESTIHLFDKNEKIYKRLISQPVPPPEPFRDLENSLKRVEEYIITARSLVQVAKYGFVLLTLTNLAAIGKKPQDIEERIKEIKNNIDKSLSDRKIVKNGDKIEIISTYELLFDKIMDKLYVLTILEEMLKELGNNPYIEYNGVLFYSLDYLENFAKRLGLKGAGKKLFMSEISGVKIRLKALMKYLSEENYDVRLDEPIPYDQIYRELEDIYRVDEDQIRERTRKLIEILKDNSYNSIKNKYECKINERNFIAHAGLERNSLLVMVRDNKFLIGYRPECKAEINKIIEN